MAEIAKFARSGVWLQVTSGSLYGLFGRNAQYWAERLLAEGCPLLATDAHDVVRRPPNLGRGRDLAAKWVGDDEAERLVAGRPRGVILNEPTTSPSMAGPLGCQSCRIVPASFGDRSRASTGVVASLLLCVMLLAECGNSANGDFSASPTVNDAASRAPPHHWPMDLRKNHHSRNFHSRRAA